MRRGSSALSLWRYAVCVTLISNLVSSPMASASDHPRTPQDTRTTTPIKHVIVIIGENRSFDHVFATYQPRKGETVSNLLSKGIVNADGTPGRNFAAATQFKARDTDHFRIDVDDSKTPYVKLPPANTDGAPTACSDQFPGPFCTIKAAKAGEPALLPRDIPKLTTGATGLPNRVIDTRIANVMNLANGPFQLTPSVKYDDYAGSPVHRFYQMWQQSDCSAQHASPQNPSGCLNDLYPWVEVTIGAGSNGKPQPQPFTDETTGEGATSMEFYNVSQGDAPYLTKLAREYTLSDNYHQAVMGGTGTNHIMLGFGDNLWYSDGQGNAAVPPNNQIENPDPQPGTNNWYTQDGYSGGTYSNCSDATQPGVTAVVNFLSSLPTKINANCDPNHYYILNNYAPGYFGDGSVNTGTFVIPPSPVRSIGDALLEKNVSWRYYGEGWQTYLGDPHFNNPLDTYCDICNPFQYSTSIMTNGSVREEHLKDITDLYNDIQDGTLPAVSYVKPGFLLDGHPASSKLDLFEGFVRKIVDQVRGNEELWEKTAIVITFDESGGYWDSGYIQPLDFFGDGPRIPTIVVSPYSKGGHVVHDYYDHVSIVKFIEKNWGLSPLTGRSRDNLPNPVATKDDPYVPTNSPAIGDLTGMFDFGKR
jgi:phospholipase C